MGLLTGKVAVVTGGASGIGAATAGKLAAEGARVVVGDINADGARTVADGIVETGGSAIPVVADVSDVDSVQALAQAAMAEFGSIHIWHNNAAAFAADVIMKDFNVVDIDLTVWERTLAVNLSGALFGCRFAIPLMLQSGGGSIINMSSIAGSFAEPVRVSYSVSKAALINLTKHVATAFGKQNIRCNAIAPGVVVTDTSRQHMGDDWIASMERVHSVPRLITPADIADAVCFLASDMASMVNGHVLTVDGGLTAHLPAG